jgi:hypothetical protein
MELLNDELGKDLSWSNRGTISLFTWRTGEKSQTYEAEIQTRNLSYTNRIEVWPLRETSSVTLLLLLLLLLL